MTTTRELRIHRLLTAAAVLVAAGSIALPRPIDASAHERAADACACGTQCKCADAHRSAPSKTPEPAPPADFAARLAAARKAADEAAAIATLRNLTSAEAQLQAACAIDCDGDGIGEYGYFGELTGASPLRTMMRRAPAVGSERLNPPVMSAKFANVQNGVVERSGYFFRIFLPDFSKQGVAESDKGGANPKNLPNADHGEVVWCAYAWPVERGLSGDRAFFVNQEGDILQCANTTKGYTGAMLAPSAEAAFAKGGRVGLIDQPLAAGTPSKIGMDGEMWTPVD